MIVLDTRGKEEAIDEMVSKIGKDIEGEGAKLDQIDHMGSRKFPSAPKGVSTGYYVNIRFGGEPDVIEKVKTKLNLNELIYMQHYQRIS